MIAIDNTLISDDIVEQYFACQIDKCKGVCCIEGDAGAPLDMQEIDILEECIEDIKPYMTQEGIDVVDSIGVFEVFTDNTTGTSLMENKACAFLIEENGIQMCAIEKAWQDGKIDFQKPISCHLYPIRITQYENYEAINYHQWDICKDACQKGKEQGLVMFKYLKTPLIRKYGEEWFEALECYYNEYYKDGKKVK